MPLYIGEIVNSFAELVLNAPLVRKVAASPIYTAMLIATVVMLIILWVFRHAELPYDGADDSLLTATVRGGLWIFLVVTVIMFFHNRVILREVDTLAKDLEIEGVFGATPVTGERLNIPLSSS